MVTSDRAEVERLILQLEREVLAQMHLKRLLATTGAIIAGHRRDLRTVEARLKSSRHATRRSH